MLSISKTLGLWLQSLSCIYPSYDLLTENSEKMTQKGENKYVINLQLWLMGGKNICISENVFFSVN